MSKFFWAFLIGLPASTAAIASLPAEPGEPVELPFDFSRSAIALEVKVKGRPLLVLLDTGVNPSVIDLEAAQSLGLPVDRSDGAEASGLGEGKGLDVFPSQIDGLVMGARTFAAFEALAADLRPVSAHYGRRLDGILGYSFLSGQIVLVDYPARRLVLLGSAAQAQPWTGSCATTWRTKLQFVDSFPVLPGFRFGSVAAPVSLDTGANGGIGLFGSALGLPGMDAQLEGLGQVSRAGARGEARARSYRFKGEVGFGPFRLPPGQVVTLHSEKGSPDTRVANVGNRLLDDMHVKMLLNYRDGLVSFFGNCR